jgi:hypothetical protein
VTRLVRLILISVALLVAAASGASAASAARAAGPEPGVVIDIPISDAQIAKLHDAGAKTARMFAFTTNRPTDFDDTVARLRAAGIRPHFVLVGDASNPPTTPRAVRGFASFARGMARHFHGKVAGWEVWNEQDAPGWWAGMPAVDGTARNARPYVRLLKKTYRALKRADHGAPVVMGGLTGNDYRFVEAVYRAGGKGFFDAVATHTDTACGIAAPSSFYRERDGRMGQFTFPSYMEVHRVMKRHHDVRPIWMTEFGWSTTGHACDSGRWAGQKPAGVSEADQAAYVAQAFAHMRRSGVVKKAMLFRFSDMPGETPHDRYGLLRADLSEKPAFGAFAAYAGGR